MTVRRFAYWTRQEAAGPSRLAGWAGRLRRDEQGAAMIEYAFVGPVFIALLLGILQVALMYLAQEGLETAAESGARLILTGEAQTLTTGSDSHTGMTAADFKNAICNGISGTNASGTSVTYPAALPPFLSCSQLYVNVAVMPDGCTTPSTAAPTFTYSGTTLTGTGTGYGSVTCGATTNTSTSGIAGTQGNMVVMQLIYLWPTISLPAGLNFATLGNGTGARMLVATSVFTVEQYLCPSSASSC